MLLLIALMLNVVYSRELTICTKEAPPFSVRDSSKPIGWSGFSWDYFNDELYYRVKETTNVKSIRVIDCSNNTEALRETALGNVDIAHAAITKTALREDIVDFTHTWFVSGFRVLVRYNNDFFATIGRIINTLGMAIGLFMSVLIVLTIGGSMILSVAEMSSPGPIDPWDTTTYFTNLIGASVVIQNTLLPGSGSIIEPHGRYSQIVLSGFKSFGAVLPPILTALITLVLVLNNSSNVIQGIDDLNGKTIIVPSGTTAEDYMRSKYVGVRRVTVSSVNEMFTRFAAGEGDALVYDWPILNSFIKTQINLQSTHKYELVGDIFQEQQYGIVVSPNIVNSSEILEGFNRAIITTWKNDMYSLLEDRWIYVKDVSIGSQVENANTQLLALLVTGSFILGIGIIVTIIWFAIRFCYGSSPVSISSRSKSLGALRNEIQQTLERQEKYARRLPPNTLTYANWEMLSSIANFLKEWKPSS